MPYKPNDDADDHFRLALHHLRAARSELMATGWAVQDEGAKLAAYPDINDPGNGGFLLTYAGEVFCLYYMTDALRSRASKLRKEVASLRKKKS